MDLRIKDKDFQFRQTDELNLDIEALELPISEHIEEMRQRSLQVLCFAFLAIGVMFLKITPIVELLEAPIEGIKFIQLSPGEYFLSTVKISFYGGLLFSIPFLLSQLIFYILQFCMRFLPFLAHFEHLHWNNKKLHPNTIAFF